MPRIDERTKSEKSLTNTGLKILLSKLKTWIETKGCAYSATRLKTPRLISINGDALKQTGADPSIEFSGTANNNFIVNQVNEPFIQWSTHQDHSASVNPIGCAMNPELSANRFACYYKKYITIETSTDGGETWDPVEVTDEIATKLTTQHVPNDTTLKIGGINNTNDTVPLKDMIRITFRCTGVIYSLIRKVFIYVSTNGCTGCKCSITGSKYADPDIFLPIKENISISGWGGWNEINLYASIGNATNGRSYHDIRFTFWSTLENRANYKKGRLSVNFIYATGDQQWAAGAPILSRTGHNYSVGPDQSTTFPGNVSVASGKYFKGNVADTMQLNSTSESIKVLDSVDNTSKIVIFSGGSSSDNLNAAI